MTLNEFIAEIEKLRDRLGGDEQLCVHASGGLGSSGYPVERVSLGFDWNHGKLMLDTKTPLMLYRKQADQEPLQFAIDRLLPVLEAKGGYVGHNGTCLWCRKTDYKGHTPDCRYVTVVRKINGTKSERKNK